MLEQPGFGNLGRRQRLTSQAESTVVDAALTLAQRLRELVVN